jgi:hypothetical protein
MQSNQGDIMKTNTLTTMAVLVAASCLAVTPASAADAAKVAGLPAVHEQGAISYLSGGIGKTEADAIRHVAKQYPLELEFLRKARPKDEYLAGVKVLVTNTQKIKVLETTSDGPYLLAGMPDGKYEITADLDGKVQHRTVEIVARQHRRIVFEWTA